MRAQGGLKLALRLRAQEIGRRGVPAIENADGIVQCDGAHRLNHQVSRLGHGGLRAAIEAQLEIVERAGEAHPRQGLLQFAKLAGQRNPDFRIAEIAVGLAELAGDTPRTDCQRFAQAGLDLVFGEPRLAIHRAKFAEHAAEDGHHIAPTRAARGLAPRKNEDGNSEKTGKAGPDFGGHGDGPYFTRAWGAFSRKPICAPRQRGTLRELPHIPAAWWRRARP